MTQTCCFPKMILDQLGVHKQAKCALFERIASHFGPSEVTQCLVKGLFSHHKSLKYGSNMCFYKDTFGLFRVHEQME